MENQFKSFESLQLKITENKSDQSGADSKKTSSAENSAFSKEPPHSGPK
jgi:hypothetical protein